MTARVLAVIADSSDRAVRQKSERSMSANRTDAPVSRMAFSVATNVNGLVTTSSPGPSLNDSKADRHRLRYTDDAGELLLELFDHAALRQPAGPDHLEHRPFHVGSQRDRRYRNHPFPPGHSNGYELATRQRTGGDASTGLLSIFLPTRDSGVKPHTTKGFDGEAGQAATSSTAAPLSTGGDRSSAALQPQRGTVKIWGGGWRPPRNPWSTPLFATLFLMPPGTFVDVMCPRRLRTSVPPCRRSASMSAGRRVVVGVGVKVVVCAVGAVVSGRITVRQSVKKR